MLFKIFISSCIRMRGGLYTQFSIPVGERWSGYYGIIYTVIKMTLTMYPLSFAQYFIALVLGAPEKAVAPCVATFFIVLAFFGVDPGCQGSEPAGYRPDRCSGSIRCIRLPLCGPRQLLQQCGQHVPVRWYRRLPDRSCLPRLRYRRCSCYSGLLERV